MGPDSIVDNAMHLCQCQTCKQERAYDPLTGHVYAGQYITSALYKEHRALENAAVRGSSHFGLLQINPPFFNDPNPVESPASITQDTAMYFLSSSSSLASKPHTPSNTSPRTGTPSSLQSPDSGEAVVLRRKLESIKEKLKHLDLHILFKSNLCVFREPPSCSSAPMTQPIPRLLEIEPSVLSNSNILHQERWLLSTQELLEILQTAYEEDILHMAEALGVEIRQKWELLQDYKMKQWELLKKAAIRMPSKVKRVDTIRHVAKPYAKLSPILMICYLIAAFMHLISAISLQDCRFLLHGLRTLVSLFAVDHPNPAHRKLQSDIPRNVGAILSLLNLEPKTKAYICCPGCFSLYDHSPENAAKVPRRCTYKSTPTSLACNALLHQKTKRTSEKPIRLFLHHELEDWIGNLYGRLDIEDYLDCSFKQSESPRDETWDILDSLELQGFLGPEGDPKRPFLQQPGTEGRLAFSLNMDGFNPFTNKESGKKATVGAIYMVCLNLPAAIRYNIENMFLVGIIPGPHEPSKEQINHVISPLVNQLCDFWLHGFFLTSTAKHPHGRLVRGAIIPLICDLPAARQMSGFAGHMSNNFCSFCTLKADEIDNFDYMSWTSRSATDHCRLAEEWRDAPSEAIRANLYQESGIRWSELLRLPYWDPTRFVMIDSMHGFFLRMFQRHCRQIWGMGVLISDSEYPSFNQDKNRPLDSVMEQAFHVLRSGSEEELRRLKPPVLRELARATNSLAFGGRTKKLVANLLAYRIERRWFNDQGDAVQHTENTAESSTFLASLKPPEAQSHSKEARGDKPKRHRNDPPTQEEVTISLQLLESGTKSRISGLRKILLVHLCGLKGIEAGQKATIPELRLKEGITDSSGNLLKGKLRQPGKPKTSKHGTGILGRETLKQIRSDMEQLQLPSWVAPAPRNPGEAKQGKFSADQWRSFCTINLTLTLNRLWGQEPEGSRKRLMLDNFMHLVTAVKLASMRCMTPDRIASYVSHIHKYLTDLLVLYPGTAITPYQHLALHFQSFLERFGPVHAWRCFPFERYNYILQNILTNKKFGELEATMLQRFCMTQRLKCLLKPEEMPSELGALLEVWAGMESEDVRGTLLSDSFTHDASFQQKKEIPTWTARDLRRLPQEWHQLLKHWVEVKDPGSSIESLSASAFMRTHIKRLGQNFQTETSSASDSHIYYQEFDGSLSAGTIQGIFSHTRQSSSEITQTFFIIKQYKPIAKQHEQHDPYRRFPIVGGQLYRDAYFDGETIISDKELLYHMGRSPAVVAQIPYRCIVALPLDRS